jgi:putative effector of murein hydrolase LrgA (UPF0299 family)
MAAFDDEMEFESSQGKTLGELGAEAGWFLGHTLIAILVLIITIAVVSLFHPDPEQIGPKLIGTVLAFFVPMVVGFIIARQQQNQIARYVWISGLLIFSIVCVWVLDLPTGNGLCEHCGALEKLWRTFFDIRHGSGLMGGDGLAVGTWIPFSLFGYAFGAKLGLD